MNLPVFSIYFIFVVVVVSFHLKTAGEKQFKADQDRCTASRCNEPSPDIAYFFPTSDDPGVLASTFHRNHRKLVFLKTTIKSDSNELEQEVAEKYTEMNVCSQWKANAPTEVLQCVTKYMNDESTKDVVAIVENQRIRCHSFIFSAVSRHFRNRFRNAPENISERLVVLEGVTYKEFKLLEELLQGRFNVTEQNLSEMLTAAKSLKCKVIENLCEDFMVQNVSVSNYEMFYKLAKKTGFSKALTAIRTLMTKNFDIFRKTELFTSLTFEEILPMVSSQSLEVASEENVLESIMRWISRHYENAFTRVSIESRNKQMVTLLKGARTYLVSVEYLKELRDHELISENDAAKSVIQDAILYHQKINRRHGQWYMANVHRNCSSLETKAVCVTYNSIFSQITLTEGFLFDVNNALLFTDVFDNQCAQVTMFDNVLYVIGRDSSLVDCSLFAYGENGWKHVLTIPGQQFLLLSLENFIYFFNMHNGDVHKMNPEHSIKNLIYAGNFPYKDKMVTVTSAGKQIVLFCKSVHSCDDPALDQETIVYCWDPDCNIWCRLFNLEDSADTLVCFHRDTTSYVLLGNGDLWRLIDSEYNFVEFELAAKLWSSTQDLQGIAGCEKMFLVFGVPKPGCGESLNQASPIPLLGKYFSRRQISISKIFPMSLPKSWNGRTQVSGQGIFLLRYKDLSQNL